MSVERAVEIIKTEGLKVIGRKKSKKHHKVIVAVAGKLFYLVCPRTPSDYRWEKNFRAQIRRILRGQRLQIRLSSPAAANRRSPDAEYGYCEPQNPFGHGHFE